MSDEYRKNRWCTPFACQIHDITAEVKNGYGNWRNERVGSQIAVSLVLWSFCCMDEGGRVLQTVCTSTHVGFAPWWY